MIERIKNRINLLQNMGLRYVVFRSKHAFLNRTGLLKKKFPVNPSIGHLPTLKEWKNQNAHFFFDSIKDLKLQRTPNADLEKRFHDIKSGKYVFFGSLTLELGTDYNWLKNPETGFVYDNKKHWTEISDFSTSDGDIKYVWEKSRFSFLYDIIRYDYHLQQDCSKFIFEEIISWIDHNPINCGPNYKCSQEITLRLFNWLFALYYYKHSPSLTDSLFSKIMTSVYWQVRHVYSNIGFSRISVRNNHAITETMGLFLFGTLLPFFPESATWKKSGKKWFEEEVAHQIYPDGTFLQFSMNYHRVVVQLLTWGIRIAELNSETINETVRARALFLHDFLFNCMNLQTGHLPNYGANDGALFFPLNNSDFSDYRPQLEALAAVLGSGSNNGNTEDQYWYGISNRDGAKKIQPTGAMTFPDGGYFLLRENDNFTMIRCGKHRDRPSQADNLHVDVWINDVNILRDSGSYKYNTDKKTTKYFFGTASHNTVMLGDFDQMKKGPRFIWYYWTQAISGRWAEFDDYFEFKGAIKAFGHLSKKIIHRRTIKKYKSLWTWEIVDEVEHNTHLSLRQIWHPAPANQFEITFSAYDDHNNSLSGQSQKAWYSPKYGIRESADAIIFSTPDKRIRTLIDVKQKER